MGVAYRGQLKKTWEKLEGEKVVLYTPWTQLQLHSKQFLSIGKPKIILCDEMLLFFEHWLSACSCL